MKNLIKRTSFLLCILLCTFFVGGCNLFCEKEPIEITSKIIQGKVNYNKMPSYCKPHKYKIVKIRKGYIIQLPHGTIESDPVYFTPEEAQEYINKTTAENKKRWIDTDGFGY
jgi:hypothetical protein